MVIEILNWLVTVSTREPPPVPLQDCTATEAAEPSGRRAILCDLTGRQRDASVYRRDALKPGQNIPGPALIQETQTTTFVSADFSAAIDAAGNIVLTHEPGGSAAA